jgi:hypothetical protein
MMVRVVMSRATRVVGLRAALLTWRRQPTTYRGPLDAFTMTAGHTTRCVGIGSVYGHFDNEPKN